MTALLAAAAVVMTGCTVAEPDAKPVTPPPTSLTVGVVGSFTSFNPASAHADTPANRAVSALLDERLGSLDGTLQVVPNNGMGRITRVENDPLRVTYELFPDRTWSDGTPVSLDDLMFGWAVTSHYFDDATYDDSGQIVSGTRYFDTSTPADPAAATIRPTVDRTKDTLTLTYAEPFADWNRQWLLDRPVHLVAQRAGVTVKDLMTAILSTPQGDSSAPIAPNPVLSAVAAAWNTGFDVPAGQAPDTASAVAAGPWTVASATADELTLARRDSYQGSHFPGIDRLTVRFFPDRASQVAAVEAGAVDIANIGETDAADLERLRAEGIQVTTGPTTQTLQMRFSATTPLALREAVTRVLDRTAIVQNAIGEARPDAKPLQSFLSSPAFGPLYDDLVSGNGAPGMGADAGGARAALDDEPARLLIAHDPTDPISSRVFADLVAMGAQGGIAVRAVSTGESPDATLAWVGEDESLYRSSRDRLADSIDVPDAARAFVRLRSSTDPVDVLARATEIDRAFFAAYAAIPLLERSGAVAVAAGVGGVAYTSEPDGVPPAFWQWTPPSS